MKPKGAADQHVVVNTSRPGNTEQFRHLLKEQQRACASLHANPLFQEFTQRSKQQPLSDAHPPVINDLEAEGQNRLFDVISKAAEAREVDRAGVWTSVGQPYVCLGVPQQLDTSAAALLPHLNRDDIQAAAAANGLKHQQPQQQQAQRRGGMRVSRTGSTGPAPGEIAAAAAAALAAAAGDSQAAGAPLNSHRGSNEADAATLLHHKTVMHFSTIDRLEASFPQAAVRQAEQRQKASKVKPKRFFNKQRAAADLADAAASYGHHAIPSKTLPGQDLLRQHKTAAAAVARQCAARDAAAAAAAAGSGRSRGGKAHTAGAGSAAAAAPDASGAAGAVGTGDTRHAFFITQQAPAGAVAPASAAAPAAAVEAADTAAAADPTATGEPSATAAAAVTATAASAARRVSVSMSAAETDVLYASSLRTSSAAAQHTAAGESSLAHPHHQHNNHYQHQQQQQGSGPHFGPITELTMQPIGTAADGSSSSKSSSNPVITWHNEFVGVRHAGYAALQQTLWGRSQDRARARGEPAAAALLSKGLLLQLAQSGGRFQPGWIPGTTPESPFAFATSQQQAQAAASSAAKLTAAEAAAAAAAAATSRLKPAEVELLEQFYESLCSLVERQRLSDPLSLTLVHKVKALLEGGTFLTPALLQGCVDCVADFSSSCGLLRFNRFVLPLLAFVRKCAGVGPAAFDAMVAAAGIEPVIYEQQLQQQGPAEVAPACQQGEQQQQQAQLSIVPEEDEEPGEAAAAAAERDGASSLGLQQGVLSLGGGSSSSGGGSSRPQSTAARPPSAAAAAVGLNAGPPGSPSTATRTSTAAAGPSPLRLDRCMSAAGQPSASPQSARGRGSSSGGVSGGGIRDSSSGGGGGSSARGGSGSGASTSRLRGGSAAGGSGLAVKPAEELSVPGITAAAAAAAAELAAAIHSAPVSQRALAAMTAGGTAAAAGDGVVRVKVPGVAGPVELVSEAAAAAAALAGDGGSEGAAAEGLGGERVDEGEEEGRLPDLGAGEDGQPLSRKLRQQEGLASWATVGQQ